MKKFFKVLLPVLLVALLLGGGIWYLRNYQGDFFSNFLQRRGDAAMAGEHYTTALRYYRWAWELDDTDPELAVSLASAYELEGGVIKSARLVFGGVAPVPLRREAAESFLTGKAPTEETAEEAETLNRIMTDINTYREEMTYKFITGQEPLDNFDAFVEQIRSQGIEEAIQIKQDALDRYLAR